ncbi:MAG: hypothetical protein RL660_1928 [Bacteroidota bacterium]
MFKNITRQVWLLSAVSLCNDAASEMLLPVLPIYLKHIGYGVLMIGIIEGIAEAIAGVGKAYFGAVSDAIGKRVPFIQIGYGLSALSKPLMGLFITPWWVLLMRISDRIGKGVRTGARDALLSAEATPETKGAVFGFHRSMDTIGAVIGPVVALIYLKYHPQAYAQMFLIAAIPGLITLLLTRLLKENTIAASIKSTKAELAMFWPRASASYKKIFLLLFLFALANSSDAFLMLKLKDCGYSDVQVILCYVLYNIVFVITAYPFGKLADKIGFEKMLGAGLLVFAAAYFLFGLSTAPLVLLIAIIVYGIFAACSEGLGKALLTNTCAKEDAGKAIGFFTAAQSLATFLASASAGYLWHLGYAHISFYASAAVACIIALILFASKPVKAISGA